MHTAREHKLQKPSRREPRAALMFAAVCLVLAASGCSGEDDALVTACSALETANWAQLEAAVPDLEENPDHEDLSSSMYYTAFQATRTTPVAVTPEMAEANLVDAFESAWIGCSTKLDDFPELGGPVYEETSEDLLTRAAAASS